MHIFTKCKLPPVLLPYITGMTCGLKFVFVFVHDYLFGLWIFLESLTLEARLKLVGYMATHKGMYKYTVEKVIPQPFKYPTCGCSMELPFHCLTITGFASTEICWIKSVFLSLNFFVLVIGFTAKPIIFQFNSMQLYFSSVKSQQLKSRQLSAQYFHPYLGHRLHSTQIKHALVTNIVCC